MKHFAIFNSKIKSFLLTQCKSREWSLETLERIQKNQHQHKQREGEKWKPQQWRWKEEREEGEKEVRRRNRSRRRRWRWRWRHLSALKGVKSSITNGGLICFYFILFFLLFYSIWFFFCIHQWARLTVIKSLSHLNLSIVTSQAQLQKSNGWNILPSLIQKLKVFFLPNVCHMKGPWKYKKEFKRISTNTKREKVRNRNHSSGDRYKKEKKEKKK